MHIAALVLVCVARAGHGHRREATAKHMKDNLYQEEFDPRSLVKLRERQSREGDGFHASLKSLSALLRASSSAVAWQAPRVGLLTSNHLPASRRSLRSGTVRQLFYDLDVLVSCAQEGTWDTFQTCLATKEPWLGVNAQGQLTITVQAAGGGVAGSIGVLGTLIAFKIRQGEVKDRLKCIYCEGSGRITCGQCTIVKDGVQTKCEACSDMGTVLCINCQGSGRSVPEEFLRRLGDEEQGITDGDLLGLFEEIPAGGKESSASKKADKAK